MTLAALVGGVQLAFGSPVVGLLLIALSVVTGGLTLRALTAQHLGGEEGLRATLAELQAEGQALHARVNSVPREEAGRLQAPCEAWATSVVRALEDGDAAFRVGHFRDEQPHGDTFYASQHADHSNINGWMQRRLSRLAEIIRDL